MRDAVVRSMLLAWIAMGMMAGGTGAVEMDLFVTDYNENPSPEQKPLVGRAIRYANVEEVTVKVGGRTQTYKGAAEVAISRAVGAQETREARLMASPGEYEPFSFLLRPRESVEQVMIAATVLKGAGGEIPAGNIVVAGVEAFQGEGRQILMPVGKAWNMSAHAPEYFWCTIKTPADAAAGVYTGEVVVSAKGERIGAIAIRLEVLPIKLEDPPFALGYNYSHPKEKKLLETHLADMRAHGMTTVASLYNFNLPVYDADTSELGAFLKAYKKAGFPGIFYFASPMDLELTQLAGFGGVETKRFQQRYIRTMRALHAEVKKHGVPTVMSIGDEMTNRGMEGVRIGEKLARLTWEELPEIATTSDMNGYMEVMRMAPYLNVATFNNGWDGADHHNKGRHLLNRAFLEELQGKTGAIPWFVNAGTGRFPYGLFFWKMTKYGVRGKVEWYYNLGKNERGSVVRLEGGKIYPTLDYERSREGIDDLKYLCTLEKLIAQAKKAGRGAAEVERAEGMLKGLMRAIEDDWTVYDSGTRFSIDGFGVVDPEKAAALGQLNSIREAVGREIVALQGALAR